MCGSTVELSNHPWTAQPGRIQIEVFVDNQVLASAVNGESCIKNFTFEDRHLMESLTQNFLEMWMTEEIVPRGNYNDFVRWIPRSRNTVADHLANISLNPTQESKIYLSEEFAKTIAEWKRRRSSAAITMHCDGGFNRDGSSIGVAVHLWPDVEKNPK